MLVLLQGAAAGYWCQNAVCAMKLGGGCGMSMAVCAWASPKNIFCYLGPMRYRHTHKYTLVIQRGTWPYKWRFIAWKINYNREIFHSYVKLPEGSNNFKTSQKARLQQGRFGEAWGFSTRALLVHSSGRGRRIKVWERALCYLVRAEAGCGCHGWDREENLDPLRPDKR